MDCRPQTRELLQRLPDEIAPHGARFAALRRALRDWAHPEPVAYLVFGVVYSPPLAVAQR